MIKKWQARRECHRSWWRCCQYCDTPLCNSPKDPHRIRWWISCWQYNRAERLFEKGNPKED